MKKGGQNIELFIKTDREAFRAQATAALAKFAPDDRELAASLQSDHASADSVLRGWSELIEPVYEDLEVKRTDQKFKKLLIKHVGFHDSDAEHMVDYLIDERKAGLLDEVLDTLYPLHDDTQYQREYAAQLLSRPQAEINDFMSRYIDFVQAIDASETYGVTLCDPHASWLERQKTALQIHKERSRTIKNEDARLEEVENQLHEFRNDRTSLVTPIMRKGWEFTTILDLRAKYQKQLDSWTKTEQKSLTKKLKLFERITASFREREAERIVSETSTHSLKELRTINEDIYSLLLEIFDLSMAQRTKLVHDIENYIKLTQERDLILLIQRNREQFLTAHDKA